MGREDMTTVTIEENDGLYTVNATTDRVGAYTSSREILQDILAVCRALKTHIKTQDIPDGAEAQLANLILLDLEDDPYHT